MFLEALGTTLENGFTRTLFLRSSNRKQGVCAQTYVDPLEKQYRELLELRERVRKAEAAAQLILRGLKARSGISSPPHDPDPRQHGVAAALGD